MSKRLVVVLVMLFVVASAALVSAAELVGPVDDEGGYIVKPAHSGDKGPIVIDTVYATIIEGKTNWHTKSVTSYITTLNVDLNWGTSSNSLRLKIYSPDGYTFGPYYDSFDGYNDGRINLYINNPNGIARGTWYYEVYGYRVMGTEDYYI